jgi:predicted transcriptional regulator
MDNIKEALISKINLTDEEAQIFIFLIVNGESTATSISSVLNLTLEESERQLSNLLEKGLILEMSGKYQTFHPKFSIINAYRRYCQKMGIEFKKNLQIDSLASSLEKMQESARTK